MALKPGHFSKYICSSATSSATSRQLKDLSETNEEAIAELKEEPRWSKGNGDIKELMINIGIQYWDSFINILP